MPSWKIHAKIANEISKYLKVNKKYFMIGNLLPDQDKYNIPTISKNVPRNLTHFISLEDYRIGINLPDYEKMYQKYKDDFKPIDELRLNKKDIYTVRKYLDLPHCRIVDDSLYQILNENVLDEIFENSIAFIIQYLQAKK